MYFFGKGINYPSKSKNEEIVALCFARYRAICFIMLPSIFHNCFIFLVLLQLMDFVFGGKSFNLLFFSFSFNSRKHYFLHFLTKNWMIEMLLKKILRWIFQLFNLCSSSFHVFLSCSSCVFLKISSFFFPAWPIWTLEFKFETSGNIIKTHGICRRSQDVKIMQFFRNNEVKSRKGETYCDNNSKNKNLHSNSREKLWKSRKTKKIKNK